MNPISKYIAARHDTKSLQEKLKDATDLKRFADDVKTRLDACKPQ